MWGQAEREYIMFTESDVVWILLVCQYLDYVPGDRTEQQ